MREFILSRNIQMRFWMNYETSLDRQWNCCGPKGFLDPAPQFAPPPRSRTRPSQPRPVKIVRIERPSPMVKKLAGSRGLISRGARAHCHTKDWDEGQCAEALSSGASNSNVPRSNGETVWPST